MLNPLKMLNGLEVVGSSFWITICSLIVLFVHSLYCSELFVVRTAACRQKDKCARNLLEFQSIHYSQCTSSRRAYFLHLSFYCVLTLNHWVHYNLYLTPSCFISSFKIAWALNQQCEWLTLIPSPSHYLGLY